MPDTRIDIRPLAADDYPAVGRIFFCAIHEGTRAAYDAAQRLAWAGETIDLDRWKARVAALTGFVAECKGEPVGFITIDRSGYVDLAFVLPSTGRSGIGGRLLGAAADWANAHGARQMTTEASLVARPFFEKHGWHVVEEETVLRMGVALRRFRMRRDLII
ncbi:GNAT family N-acetyltransferase [Gemmobacter denitrificans]|uniref:GNAT family N-acetyltransferase n=1 Tax=Gemmobacter denitrificans TaxID=3123040 RepID=A0ABU8BZF4_9RHOB